MEEYASREDIFGRFDFFSSDIFVLFFFCPDVIPLFHYFKELATKTNKIS